MSTISRFRSRHQTLPFGAFTPPPDPPASAPENFVVVSGGDTSIDFSWDAVAGADDYELQIGPSGGPYEPVDGNPFAGLGGTIELLDFGTEYCLQVRACNSGGCSVWSEQGCATTDT